MRPIPYNEKEMWHIDLKNDETGEVYTGEYIDMRLQPETIPTDKFAYNCRHGDEGEWEVPVTIETGNVIVNFSGTFITDTEIEFPAGQDYICVTLLKE